uniref:Uncharacterized protein n=1 Tax=Pseudo-nitzschia australis TaxID=44445 RepID=A0A6V0AQJ4_9STRA|mmetsp:Transcript_6824/g.14514  ORF Transcript_6824/g.14514 Transcript_6824/m.14514 type:complete len:279 (-) Transcript_6824:164-1000(-)
MIGTLTFRLSLAALAVSLCCIFCTTTVITVADAFASDLNRISAKHTKGSEQRVAKYDELRRDWSEKSLSYYSKVMREERRRKMGQIDSDIVVSEEYQQEFERLAKKHYFALQKIKAGRYRHAEIIYERIIRDIMQEDKDGQSCDHAKLAVTTLLLALHCQRMGNMKKTRSVFLNFFRKKVVMNESRMRNDGNIRVGNIANDANERQHEQCACSAKVLGAFALFEMKRGNSVRSLRIAQKAIDFDPSMGPMLEWKQFRDVRMRTRRNTRLTNVKDPRQP